MWGLCAGLRLGVLLIPGETRLLLIPEPLNTLLFAVSGVILLAWMTRSGRLARA